MDIVLALISIWVRSLHFVEDHAARQLITMEDHIFLEGHQLTQVPLLHERNLSEVCGHLLVPCRDNAIKDLHVGNSTDNSVNTLGSCHALLLSGLVHGHCSFPE